MQWKPNRSKPLIAGIPLKRPSQEQVNKAYMLFYSMIGGFASVVQTQITDVYNYARQDKKLFRMEAKKRLTEAKRCSDELLNLSCSTWARLVCSRFDSTSQMLSRRILGPIYRNAFMLSITSS